MPTKTRAHEVGSKTSGGGGGVDDLPVVDFQGKTRAKTGRAECYWFENQSVGLTKTRFHRVVIPFEPFDSGLDCGEQPEAPELVVDWAQLELDDPSDLEGVDLSMEGCEGVEASIYLGGAHNWTHLSRFLLTKAGEGFTVHCVARIEFENEGVAKNEALEFKTTVVYGGEV